MIAADNMSAESGEVEPNEEEAISAEDIDADELMPPLSLQQLMNKNWKRKLELKEEPLLLERNPTGNQQLQVTQKLY